MPYTPPSHRSPASSASSSPNTSRRSSFQEPSGSKTRPPLPRSSSYLTRHRRTPSFSNGIPDHVVLPGPDGSEENPKQHPVTSSSIRQSPPPFNAGRRMPNGAILSPPASPPELPLGDDEEADRGRQIDEDLKALHDAISRIPQHRESSPDKEGSGDVVVVSPSQIPVVEEGLRQSLSTSALSSLALGRRRSGHTRSVTEPNAVLDPSPDRSWTGSEDDSDDSGRAKPQMVRKKSGELVRPALRASSSHRRPLSMPGTPTFSKAVHFDAHLEHVRHFLQIDRPVAVSAGSSPVDSHDSDGEYPFPGRDGSSKSPPFEWEMSVANFPADTPARKAQPVRLERVWLSNEQKCLMGSVVVANMAFQKHVTCRFTLDAWKTTSEVSAEYFNEVQPRESPEGRDRFHFSIELSDTPHLESKTLYLCVRYSVAGQELWDNNADMNFRIDFRKKFLPRNGKKGVAGAASRPANQLPRSSRRAKAAAPESNSRSTPGPAGTADQGEASSSSKMKLDPYYLGESDESMVPKLKNPSFKPAAGPPGDDISSGLAAPSGQAFASRYDFGASLTAAVKAAKGATTVTADSGGLYMKSLRKTQGSSVRPQHAATPGSERPASLTVDTKARPLASGAAASSPGIASSSYEELVNKYCFFGSKPRQAKADDSFNNSNNIANGGTSSMGSPAGPTGYPRRHQPIHNMPPAFPSPNGRRPATVIGRPTTERTTSPELPPPRASSASGQTARRSPSPAEMVSGLHQLADGPAADMTYNPLNGRFPFSGLETHAAAEIKG